MIHFTCDMCGRPLQSEADTRYVVKIEVHAAYDPLELTPEDLEEDRTEEMEELLEQMADLQAEEVENQVYKAFRYDLCPDCQAAYMKDPLGKAVRLRARFEHN